MHSQVLMNTPRCHFEHSQEVLTHHNFIETSNSNHNSVNKYSVKYSLRDPHGAHTVTFTHVGQGVSGDHISKIHLTSIMTSRLQASSYESQSCKAAHEIIVLKHIGERLTT